MLLKIRKLNFVRKLILPVNSILIENIFSRDRTRGIAQKSRFLIKKSHFNPISNICTRNNAGHLLQWIFLIISRITCGLNMQQTINQNLKKRLKNTKAIR